MNSKSRQVCWNGCSFTVGEGFDLDQRDLFTYRAQVDRQFAFSSDVVASCGASNYVIFMKAVAAVMSNRYDIVFTQWSALNRLWLHPGPDCEFYTNENKNTDFVYRNIRLTPSDKRNLQNTLRLLNHDYHNLLDLITYCNVLEKLAQHTHTKLVYINGLVPWCSDLDNHAIGAHTLDQLSDYTRSILDSDNRDNDEVFGFFSRLQQNFATLNKQLWVNIYDSMHQMTVDIAPQGHHPGAKTHQWMYNRVVEHLSNEIK